MTWTNRQSGWLACPVANGCDWLLVFSRVDVNGFDESGYAPEIEKSSIRSFHSSLIGFYEPFSSFEGQKKPGPPSP